MLLAPCLGGKGLMAQNSSVPVQGLVTAQATSCSPAAPANACVFLPIPPQVGSAAITLAGTWTATLQFEGSADGGATWVSIPASTTPGATGSTTSTGANGSFFVPTSGLSAIRVRASAYTSGVVQVTLNPSQASAASGGVSAGSSVTVANLTVTNSITLPGNGMNIGQNGQTGSPSILNLFGGTSPTAGPCVRGGDNVFSFPTCLYYSPLSSGILCATQTIISGECPAGEILAKGPQAVSTAAVTIGTAATDTQVAELTVDSGFLNQANRVVTIRFGGNYTTVAAQTPTITVKLKLCTVSGCGSGTVVTLGTWGPSGATTASVTNSFGGNCDLATTATGATGTVILKNSTVFEVLGATAGTTPTFVTDANTAVSSAIALNGQLFLDLVWQYSTGTTNTVTVNDFRVN